MHLPDNKDEIRILLPETDLVDLNDFQLAAIIHWKLRNMQHVPDTLNTLRRIRTNSPMLYDDEDVEWSAEQMLGGTGGRRLVHTGSKFKHTRRTIHGILTITDANLIRLGFQNSITKWLNGDRIRMQLEFRPRWPDSAVADWCVVAYSHGGGVACITDTYCLTYLVELLNGPN